MLYRGPRADHSEANGERFVRLRALFAQMRLSAAARSGIARKSRLTSTADPVRMILVVDTGIDDALALALAVRHPRIHLEAVVTSWGNVGLELVNDNTLRVLDWLEAIDVRVVSGADRPLGGEASDAGHLHGQDGSGGARLPASTRAGR